jgi:NAD(P)-dependent dehydrogenase (short-subunit alcohol dehydrogenase family)
MKLRDRVAVVTGAAKGMGDAICEALVREGASVVAAARDAGPLGALVERLERLEGAGGRHLAVPM